MGKPRLAWCCFEDCWTAFAGATASIGNLFFISFFLRIDVRVSPCAAASPRRSQLLNKIWFSSGVQGACQRELERYRIAQSLASPLRLVAGTQPPREAGMNLLRKLAEEQRQTVRDGTARFKPKGARSKTHKQKSLASQSFNPLTPL